MPIAWITGAHGFIGRHLARYLALKGYTVCGIGHGLWPIEAVAAAGIAFWSNGEIDASNLTNVSVAVGRPNIIFHLAGGSSVGPSLQNPLEDFRRTVDTTVRLLDWVRSQSPDTTVVCTSSAAVYGAGHWGPIPETSPLTPFSPYGNHKAIMEMLCNSYRSSFGIDTRVVRLFSVYGPGLKKQLLWDLCCKLKTGTGVVTLGGSGRELRDWINVNDAVDLLRVVAESAAPISLVVNGGSGIGTTVREIAELVCASWGGNILVKFSGERRKGDPDSLVADTTRALQVGYSTQVSLQRGIDQYVQSFKTSREAD